MDVIKRGLIDGLGMLIFAVGKGEVGAFLAVENRKIAARHVQRLADVLLHKFFPSLPENFSHQISGGHYQHVVVVVAATEVAIALQEAETVDEVFATEGGGIPGQVVTRKSGAMTDQIAWSHTFAGYGIVHLEIWKILPHRLVPIEFALVVENSHGNRSKGFGD